MSGVEILELDARGLNHPEPLERSVEIFRRLDSSNLFHLLIHRLPQPLLAIAERHGIRFEVCEAAENEWHIIFSKSAEFDLKKVMKGYCSVQ